MAGARMVHIGEGMKEGHALMRHGTGSSHALVRVAVVL
jgi:hypothetical protein